MLSPVRRALVWQVRATFIDRAKGEKPIRASDEARIKSFSNIVFEAGISAPVRTPRGRDIDAACGQLKTAAERKRRATAAA